ncbi:MAG: hypothetical protein Kow00129_16760 [Thermoleophilia bacterium]
MPISKVTRKGQITIPQAIRAELGIREGDSVQVYREDDRVVVRRVARWRDLAGSLREMADDLPLDEKELSAAAELAWVDRKGDG